MIKIIDEKTIYLKKVKIFEIETSKGCVKIERYWINDELTGEYDCDYEILEESKKVFEALEDEEQDELGGFINELN